MIRPTHRKAWLAIGLAMMLAGCTPPAADSNAALACPTPPGQPVLVFQLFFGRSIPALGEVTDRDWDQFVDRVITPNLPNGFTVFDATGEWMNPQTHGTIHERTKVLLAALPRAPNSIAPIERIRNAYQAEFHQQLVGMTVAPGCGDF